MSSLIVNEIKILICVDVRSMHAYVRAAAQYIYDGLAITLKLIDFERGKRKEDSSTLQLMQSDRNIAR